MEQRRLCVWLVTDVYPPGCGGSGWSTHALARALVDHGHRVQAIVVNQTQSRVTHREFDRIDVTEVGVRRARLSLRRRLGAFDFSYGMLESYLERRLRADADVDVLHAQHQHSGPPSVSVGRAHGRATVVTVRDYWPVCLHGTSWWGGNVCDGCTASRLTGCMTEYFRWPRPVSSLMVQWARRRLEARKLGVGNAHRVLAVSEAVRARLSDELPAANLSVVPNMVDPVRLASEAASVATDTSTRPFLLTAGKLIPTKGVDRLLSALAEVGATLPLVVAGAGPERPALERQAQGLGLDVSFRGWVAHDELLSLQRAALAVVVPSAWQEPLSRLILETMALGTPVIAWAGGGTPEIIETGSSGWVVTCPEDLARALRELDDDDRRREVGRAGRERLRARYSQDVVLPLVQDVYLSALQEAGRR